MHHVKVIVKSERDRGGERGCDVDVDWMTQLGVDIPTKPFQTIKTDESSLLNHRKP
jgi:hypothetical protein